MASGGRALSYRHRSRSSCNLVCPRLVLRQKPSDQYDRLQPFHEVWIPALCSREEQCNGRCPLAKAQQHVWLVLYNRGFNRVVGCIESIACRTPAALAFTASGGYCTLVVRIRWSPPRPPPFPLPPDTNSLLCSRGGYLCCCTGMHSTGKGATIRRQRRSIWGSVRVRACVRVHVDVVAQKQGESARRECRQCGDNDHLVRSIYKLKSRT